MITFDFHTHFGRSKSDGAHADAREVFRTVICKETGITRAVIFPVDQKNPGNTYTSLNTQTAKIIKKYPEFIGFCRLNPNQGAKAIQEMHRSFSLGLAGVKLHPRSEKFSPDAAVSIFKELNKRIRPLIIHTSQEKHCRPGEWFNLLSRYRHFPVILAHSGKDAYQEAILIAKRLRNVYLETSTLSYFRTRRILKEAGAQKIVFASDFPYSHPRVEMEKWRSIWNQKEKRLILSVNPLKILGPWL